MNTKQKIAVIGAGWAGLTAAVRLAQRGADVTVFEANRTPGGRARRVEFDGALLDNGQHILLGAYTACLSLFQEVGVPANALQRLPLQMRYWHDGGFTKSFQAARLPAPWHLALGLLSARGFAWRDKWALVNFMQRLKKAGWRTPPRQTVAALIADLPVQLRTLFLEPLCISALNTAPEQACAQVFSNVLRDSLAASAAHSDMLIPQTNLTALFAEPALRYLKQRGATVKLGCAVKHLQPLDLGLDSSSNQGFALDEHGTFSQVILATPPTRTRDFLQALNLAALTPLMAQLDTFEYEPITTVYLKPRLPFTLPAPFVALESEAKQPGTQQSATQQSTYGQFVFQRNGWLAVVISAAREASVLTQAELTQAVQQQLCHVFQQNLVFSASRVISEKRATFSCTPNLSRPAVHTPLPGLWLAGDYVAPTDPLQHYPATLEAAVRAGEAAVAAM